MSAKQVEQLRKQIAQLEAQLADREAENALLQGEDSANDAKVDQLTKLQAQKVRALMRSIQELKKENATLKRQSAEHKRSDLIEKLKSEIEMQDIVIEALRAAVNDEEKCNRKIEEFLNRGPPRIRAVSREELKIEIKRLKGLVAALQAKAKGAKAVDDFDKMMSRDGVEEEKKGVDTQHNEKIVELLEEVENLRVELSAKDVKIEYLAKTVKKLNQELSGLRLKENELELTGQAKTNLESQLRELQDDLQVTASGKATSASTVQEKELEISSLKGQIRDLEGRLRKDKEAQSVMAKQYQAEREGLKEKLAKTLADLEDLRARQDSKGKQGEVERTKLRELLAKKDERIAVLEDELRNSAQAREQLETEIEHLQSQIGESQAQETELLLLREQLVRLAKSQNVPSDMLKAETTRADTFKKRTIELSKQVANLQETLEQQSSDLQYLRKQGAAIRLHSRDPNPTERQDYKDLVFTKLQLEDQVKVLTTKIEQLEAENQALHSQNYERSLRMSQLEQEMNRRSVEMLRPEDSKNTAVVTVDLRSMKADIQEGLEGMHPQPVIDLRGVTAQAAVKASSRIKENLLRILAK